MSAEDSLHPAGERVDPEEFRRTRAGRGGEAFDHARATVAEERILGDFRIIRELGRGGMGVVYEAEQISLKRRVALKVLPAQLSLSAEQVQRFQREAQAGGRQRHPGIVSIYAVGEQAGVHFIAQELVEGGATLADLLRRRRAEEKLPREYFREIAALFAEVAEAMAHAHANGVIHCDIKPSNILLTAAGSPKVGDFGLARIENALALTRTGQFEGTPFYVSPEQVARPKHGLDARTDIFSLGATLYEALTLEVPFAGDSALDVLRQVMQAEPMDPCRRHPRVPRDLAVICLHAMEREPNARYASMRDFAADLRRWLAGEAILARPAGAVTRALKWTRRRRGALAAGLSVAALAMIWLGAASVQEIRERSAFQSLVAQAGAAADTQQWDEAIDLLVQARSIKPDDRVAREMHRLYMQQKELAAVKAERDAKEAALRRSDGLRLMAEAQKQSASNPGLALLLALESAKRLPGLASRNAVGEALSICWERRTVPIRRHPFLPELQKADRQWPRSVRFSPDGSKLLTTAWDPTPALWDAETGERLLLLGRETHARRVDSSRGPASSLRRDVDEPSGFSMARFGVFSPDGRTIALTDGSREACVIDVDTGEPAPKLAVPAQWGFHIAYSPDGRQVAAVCPADSSTRIWDATTGSELFVLRHAGRPNALAYSPDSRLLAVAAGDGTTRVYAARSGIESLALRSEFGSRTVRFRPDGAVLASAEDGGMDLWDLPSGKRKAAVRAPWNSLISVWGIEFSPDGSLVTTSWGDSVARVWRVADGKEALQLRGHAGVVRAIAFSPDGTRIVTACFDKTARIWDAKTGKTLAVLMGHDAGLHEAWFSPDGRRVATISEDETVRIWDAETRPRKDACETGDLHAVFFEAGIVRARDGRRLEIPERFGGVKLVLPSGEALTLSRSREAMGARFSPDETLVVTGSRDHEDGWVEIWDARNGAFLREVLVSRAGATLGACLLDDNRALMSTATENALRLWDWRSGQERQCWRGHAACAAAYGPGRERLVTAGSDGTVRMWDARTGEAQRIFRGHTDAVIAAVVSPDGTRIVSHSEDDTARLWNAETGEELLTIRGVIAKETERVGFDSGGKEIVIVANDGTTRSRPVDVIAAAEARKPRELTPEEHKTFAVWEEGEEEALALVERLFDEHILAREVIAEIESDEALDESVRRAALRFARLQEDDATMLLHGAGNLMGEAPTPAGDARAAAFREAAARLQDAERESPGLAAPPAAEAGAAR